MNCLTWVYLIRWIIEINVMIKDLKLGGWACLFFVVGLLQFCVVYLFIFCVIVLFGFVFCLCLGFCLFFSLLCFLVLDVFIIMVYLYCQPCNFCCLKNENKIVIKKKNTKIFGKINWAKMSVNNTSKIF